MSYTAGFCLHCMSSCCKRLACTQSTMGCPSAMHYRWVCTRARACCGSAWSLSRQRSAGTCFPKFRSPSLSLAKARHLKCVLCLQINSVSPEFTSCANDDMCAVWLEQEHCFIRRQLCMSLIVQDLYAAINTMKDPSFIRVEADEVTYPLHVIIRCRTQGTILRNPAILTSISCALFCA